MVQVCAVNRGRRSPNRSPGCRWSTASSSTTSSIVFPAGSLFFGIALLLFLRRRRTRCLRATDDPPKYMRSSRDNKC
jgi:hypothetical protein